MKICTISFLVLVAALMVGCKSGGAAADDSTKPTADATTGSTAGGDAATKDSSSVDKAPDASADKTADSTANGGSIVGNWDNDDKSAPIKDKNIEFKDDGSMSITGKIDPEDTGLEMDGTYKIEGDKLTLHSTAMKLTPSDTASADTKKSIDEQNAKSADEAAKHKDDVATIKWSGKDSFVMTGASGKPVTFTRKAS
jgi:uncharacterized protein (TIGR03066 family)